MYNKSTCPVTHNYRNFLEFPRESDLVAYTRGLPVEISLDARQCCGFPCDDQGKTACFTTLPRTMLRRIMMQAGEAGINF